MKTVVLHTKIKKREVDIQSPQLVGQDNSKTRPGSMAVD
jgi:hypothetical protein